MPRKARTTMSGEKAQAVSPVAGQMYGAGVEQAALQRAMPAPQARSASSPATPNAVPPTAAAGPNEPPMPSGPSRDDQFRLAMQAAQQMKGQPGLFNQPTDRPGEPVTTGLASGPGAGPEVLGTRGGNPTAQTLRRLSQLVGDPYFDELARRAGY